MFQNVSPQSLHSYLHPVFAPADLEAAAVDTGGEQVTGGGFLQLDDSTPFLSISGLTTGQFRLRIKLTSMEGGADARSPAYLQVTPALSATVLSATATFGTIQSIEGIGTTTIHVVPDTTVAAKGYVDITVTCSSSVTVDLQLFHRRFVATASAYQTAA